MHNDLFYKLKHKLSRLQTNVLKAEIVGSVFENRAMNLQREKKREKETWRASLITPEPTDTDTPLPNHWCHLDWTDHRFRLGHAIMVIWLNFSGHIPIFPERQFSTSLQLGCIKYQVNTSNYLGNDPSAKGSLPAAHVLLGRSVPSEAGDLVCNRVEQAVSAVMVLTFGIIAPVNGN